MQRTGPADQGGGIDLATCLRMPEFDGARVLSVPATRRPIRWVSVIERPVEDFVNEHDLVLTTGLACDEAQLCRLLAEVAGSGAAAACLATGHGAAHPAVPDAAVAAARASGIALVELPWRIRFSDLTRAVIRAIGGGSGRPPAADDTPAAFGRALLSGADLAEVATALERVTAAAVVVLDPGTAVLGAGRAGRGWIGEQANLRRLVAALSAVAGRTLLAGREPVVVGRLDDGRALAVAAAAAGDTALGRVVCVLPTGEAPEWVCRAVAHAATAVAFALASGAPLPDARAGLLLALARGDAVGDDELAEKAGRLGLAPDVRYRVCVGRLEPATADGPAGPDLLARIRRRLRHPASIAALDGRRVLLALHPGEAAPADLVGAVPAVVTWGCAAGGHRLRELAEACAQAAAVAAVSGAVHGRGSVGDAAELGPYLLLAPVAADHGAMRAALAVIEPLARSDRARRSALVETLAAFLAENGNTSAAARVLHLNRHSLIHRLRRIEELTGLSLSSHEHRTMLELSVRLHRLRGLSAADPGRPG